VTGRHGGVSEEPYAQLNLGLHVRDDSERVVENRRRVSRALGVDFENCTFARQVHGDAIHLVADDQPGAGRERFEEGIPETDGLVANRPGVTIAVLVADCVPLLIYDPERHVGAAVHAGWRGTAATIAAKAVRFLEEECGSRPDALLVGVGPAIGSCCYRVGADVVKALEGGSGCQEPLAREREGRWYVDLVRANRGQLLAAGIRPENIEAAGICTACQAEEFYSERKLGRPTGRFGAFLSLR